MPPKARYTKPGKPGRSIEEVMIQRRLDATDPTSWPTGSSRPQMPLTPVQTGAGGVTWRGSMSMHETQQSQASDDYSTNIEPLKDYCRDLVKKNQTLEQQLAGTVKIMQKELKKVREKAQETQEIQKMLLLKDMDKALEAQQKRLENQFQSTGTMRDDTSVGGLSYSQTRRMMEANTPKPIITSESTMGKISSSMTELDMKIVHLKEIFRQGDPMEERRVSVNKINACVRGFLQRRRYDAYKRGSREWKWLRCRQIIWLLDMNMGLQARLDTGIDSLKVMHNFRALYSVYVKWLHITRQALPVRRAMYTAAMAKKEAKDYQLKKKIWTAFKSVTVGGKSTKEANAQRREMVTSIREELSEALKAKGEIGVVPEEDIERILYRRVLLSFLESKKILNLKSVFINGFWKNVLIHRKNNSIALNHRLLVHAGKIFYAWSEWVFMVGAGLDRKRWSQPRQYQVHYNQKRVDAFSGNRLKKYIFYPWKEFYLMQHNVRKMLQRQLGRFCKANFLAWRVKAKELRILRITTVDNWRGYARLLTQTPFQGWAEFVKGVKNHNNEQQRIVNSYLRWKWRQRIVIIMKRWRHQALYGRIDGLYTRQMLIASLNEQKIMTAGLEKMMAAQTVEVDECRELTERELNKRKLLENRLKESQENHHKSKMYSHHAEQEMKRMEAIIEAVALLNPRQVEHLKRLQPQFQFKQRRVNIPKDEEESDQENEDGEEDEDGEDEDGEHGQTHGKQPKKSSLLGDDDDDDDEDCPSNVCPKCRQLLPDENAPPTPTPAQQQQQTAPNTASSNIISSPGTANNNNLSNSNSNNNSNSNSPQGGVVQGRQNLSVPNSPNANIGEISKQPSFGDTSDAGFGTGSIQSVPDNNSEVIGENRNSQTNNDFFNTNVDGFQQMPMDMDPSLNIISDEDMILLERVKFIIKYFYKPTDQNTSVPMVIPGEEIHTKEQVEEEKVDEDTETNENKDIDSDDEAAVSKRPRGNIEDEMEVTKAKVKKIVKPKTITKISWTPGQLILPDRGPILPAKVHTDDEAIKHLEEPQEVIIGPDGLPDTLLPGDPVHEPAGVDPEDTAARMLLGVMSFLQEGDVTTFAPIDRRAWTQEVLMTVEHNKMIETAKKTAEEEKLRLSVDTLSESKHHHHSMRVTAAAEIIGGAKNWRNALLSLRTMHPGAGNYSGVGVELDSSESGLYRRVVEMRDTLDTVLVRQAGKFDQKIQRSRARAHHREKLIIAARLKAEAEEAERQRIAAEELAEKERIAAEEAAKMAAMRAAKAARRLEHGSDSDESDSEDEGADIVNPYASLLGSEFKHAREEVKDEEAEANDMDGNESD
jgi:hypothetical protein